jgi:hypothetical protein
LPGDADKDGAVTKAEATAGVAKMAARIDANSDGTLTKDELGRGCRGHGRHHRSPRSDAE